ncbi:MAG: GNAT family N-acetyltransferase [Planctomycetota bacterium]
MRLKIWTEDVGDGCPCFVVAEIGSNHNGSLERAREMVAMAADAGADAVKFQTFRASRLYPRTAGTSDYLGLETPIYDIIEAMEMPEEWLAELAALSHDLGLAFLSSPFHEEAVGVLAPHVDAMKVASYEMTHEPLLDAVAASGKPLVMSCGASTFEETAHAVRRLQAKGVRDLVLLQCTAAYPSPPESIEVGALVELRERLGVLTGLSDHSEDPAAAPAVAASLGAVLVEKHVTMSKSLPGPDHAFAIEPDGLAALVRAVREAETLRGRGRKRVHPVEEELRTFARRSIFTTRAIVAGEALSRANVDVLRQGKAGVGLAPRRIDEVIGGRAARDLAEGAPVSPGDVLVEGVALIPDPDPDARVTPTIDLRPAEERDLGLVWAWANDAGARLASLVPGAIPYSSHVEWFRSALADPDRRMWIAEESGDPVAFLRLDGALAVSLEGADPPEVSLNVAPTRRTGGVGRAALEALAAECASAGATRIGAALLEGNQPSRRCFEAAGFRREGRRTLRGVEVDWYVLELSPERA